MSEKCLVYIKNRIPQYNFNVAMAFKFLGFPHVVKNNCYEVTNHTNSPYFEKALSRRLLDLNKYGLEIELKFL